MDKLAWRSDLSWWRALLTWLDGFSDVTTWGLGRWINPGWDEPLPDVLVLDDEFFKTHRGNPFLYHWRIRATDLTSLGAAAGIKAGVTNSISLSRNILTRTSRALTDFSAFVGLGYAIETAVGFTRESDEILTGKEESHPLFWLSLDKIKEAGYTSYDIVGDHYVFYK